MLDELEEETEVEKFLREMGLEHLRDVVRKMKITQLE